MHNHSEWLVGGLAIAIGGLIGWQAVIHSPPLYRLRTVAAVRRRFGRRAACGLLLAIAALLFAAGVMILGGVRPRYAIPAAAEPTSDLD